MYVKTIFILWINKQNYHYISGRKEQDILIFFNRKTKLEFLLRAFQLRFLVCVPKQKFKPTWYLWAAAGDGKVGIPGMPPWPAIPTAGDIPASPMAPYPASTYSSFLPVLPQPKGRSFDDVGYSANCPREFHLRFWTGLIKTVPAGKYLLGSGSCILRALITTSSCYSYSCAAAQ